MFAGVGEKEVVKKKDKNNFDLHNLYCVQSIPNRLSLKL